MDKTNILPAIISLAILIPLIAYQIYYLILLKRLFETIKSEFSIKKPWTVWLTLIPILGNLWWYYLIFKAKKGTENTLSYFNSQEKSNAGFYWFIIGIILLFATGFLNNHPILLVLSFIIGFTSYIIHGVKVYKARKLILKTMEDASHSIELR